MAFYKTHVIRAGETLQDIATQQLNDVSRWYELVTLNNLVYPYIVPTNKDRIKDIDHLLTVGDRIKLPEENSISQMDINKYSKSEIKDIYDMSMGMDIAVNIHPDYSNGSIDELAYMYPNKSHNDLAKVSGIDNLKQSIQMRLMTQYGTLPYHPNYGTHLLSIIGDKMNNDTISRIKIEIIRTIKTDVRVKDAKIAQYVTDGDSFTCSVEVTPMDANDEFNMFVDLANTGQMRFE